MNRTFYTKLILCISILLIPLGTLYSQTGLWEKAVDLSEKSSGFSPGRMVILNENLNKEGEIKSREKTIIELYETSDGTVETRILYAEKDGEEITESRRKENDRGNNREDEEFEQNPFARDIQDQVEKEYNGTTRYINGTLHYGFDFSMPGWKKSRFIGTAWLQKNTGAPAELSLTLEPLPMFVTHMDIYSNFTLTEEGVVLLKNLTIDGGGTFLFINRIFHSEIEFSDYFPLSDN